MVNHQNHFTLNNNKSIITILNHLIISVAFLPSLLYSQNYIWPVKAEKNLTAVFGEERPGRYHTGIDIRTFGETGYPLLAIENGYISRIRTSSKKYGKTIYLRLNDENTAVYAHLDHFNPELDNLASALQDYYGKYEIDHILKENKYIVEKGDIIGYSGDTGGVSGPHLHFELRDKDQNPLNPFNFGLYIEDDIPPFISSIALIPLNRDSYINGLPKEQVFIPKKINDNEYILEDTIAIQGSFGLAVKTSDFITKQEFSFGIYSVNLYKDNNFIYSMQYDKIKWEDVKSLYTEKSYSLARKGLGKFYHLFSHHNNQSLTFINSKSKSNLTISKPDIQNAIITVSDYAKNQVHIKLSFSSSMIPEVDYNANFNNDTCFIQFDPVERIRPYFYRINRYDNTIKISSDYYDMGNNLFIITDIEKPLDIIEIYIKNKLGIKSHSTFHIPKNEDYKIKNGKLTLNHYEHGIIITFKEDVISGLDAFLTLEKNGIIYPHELKKDSPLTYVSNLFSPSLLSDVSEIKVYYDTPEITEILKMDQEGFMIIPDSTFNFSFFNDQVLINGVENTFYDTVYFWTKNIDVIRSKDVLLASPIIKIFPNLIPFNKEINLQIALNKYYFPKYLNIYSYNEEKESWNFMPSSYNMDSTYMQTKILSGEVFAIIKEEEGPVLSSFIPQINGTYYSSDLEHISFHIEDEFSGIDGEQDVSIELDGKSVIFEYNSFQKKIRYPLKYNLKSGTHTLFVEAKDRVGNKSIVEGTFFIKEK